MADENEIGFLTKFDVGFDGIPEHLTRQITVQEITLGESLLTPGLQTSVRVHSSIHELPVKNLDDFWSEHLDPKEAPKRIEKLKKAMLKAAKDLDFEQAAQLRDEIKALEAAMIHYDIH